MQLSNSPSPLMPRTPGLLLAATCQVMPQLINFLGEDDEDPHAQDWWARGKSGGAGRRRAPGPVARFGARARAAQRGARRGARGGGGRRCGPGLVQLRGGRGATHAPGGGLAVRRPHHPVLTAYPRPPPPPAPSSHLAGARSPSTAAPPAAAAARRAAARRTWRSLCGCSRRTEGESVRMSECHAAARRPAWSGVDAAARQARRSPCPLPQLHMYSMDASIRMRASGVTFPLSRHATRRHDTDTRPLRAHLDRID